jgi:hypothetical protein
MATEKEVKPLGNLDAEVAVVADDVSAEPNRSAALHGLQLWTLVIGMFLGVYLAGLDLTMLSTVCFLVFFCVSLSGRFLLRRRCNSCQRE